MDAARAGAGVDAAPAGTDVAVDVVSHLFLAGVHVAPLDVASGVALPAAVAHVALSDHVSQVHLVPALRLVVVAVDYVGHLYDLIASKVLPPIPATRILASWSLVLFPQTQVSLQTLQNVLLKMIHQVAIKVQMTQIVV